MIDSYSYNLLIRKIIKCKDIKREDIYYDNLALLASKYSGIEIGPSFVFNHMINNRRRVIAVCDLISEGVIEINHFFIDTMAMYDILDPLLVEYSYKNGTGNYETMVEASLHSAKYDDSRSIITSLRNLCSVLYVSESNEDIYSILKSNGIIDLYRKARRT